MEVSQSAGDAQGANPLYLRDGTPLPPANFRAAGANFAADAGFLHFARTDANLLNDHKPTRDSRILDFGCGVGRLYYGFDLEDEPARYLGLDIRRDVIHWAQAQITPRNARFRFEHRDVRNERYNANGSLDNESWLGSLDGAFDIAYVYSVLTHMLEKDARSTLALLHHAAHPDSLVLVTAFVRQQAEPIIVNPVDQGIAIAGPLHVVRYDEAYFCDELLRPWFSVEHALPGYAADGQIFYVLRPRK